MERPIHFILKSALLGLVLVSVVSNLAAYAQRFEYRVGPQDHRSSRDRYGAIAYSASRDRCGSSYNYRTRGEAESRAISECGEADCEVKIWFKNGCGAMAISKSGWGCASAGHRGEAERKAIRGCSKHGDGCSVRCWSCTDR